MLHGHGAKGGAYARLAAAALRRRGPASPPSIRRMAAACTTTARRLKGRAFLGLEQLLVGLTDGLIFESDYSRRAFEAKVGATGGRARVIHNGLTPAEFERGDARRRCRRFPVRRRTPAPQGRRPAARLPCAAIGATCASSSAPDRTQDAFKARAAALGLAAPTVELHRRPAGATDVRQGPLSRCAIAGRIVSLYRPRSRRRRTADDRHRRRRHPGDLWQACRPADRRRRWHRARNGDAALPRRPGDALATAATLRQSLQQRFTVERMAAAILAAYARWPRRD